MESMRRRTGADAELVLQATPPTPAVKNMQVAMHPKVRSCRPSPLSSTSLPSDLRNPGTRRLRTPRWLLFVKGPLSLTGRDDELTVARDTQGIREDPKDEPHKAGGDLKGRSPPK